MCEWQPRLLHILPCEWNRQLGSDWDPTSLSEFATVHQRTFLNASVHGCPRPCGALHTNHAAFKCLCAFMTSHPGCDTWHAFQLALASPTNNSGRGPVDLLFGGTACPRLAYEHRKTFLAELSGFYADCCVKGYRGPLRPPEGVSGAVIVTAGLRRLHRAG